MKRQLHIGAKLSEEHFRPVQNRDDGWVIQKPSGGLWTSSYVKKSSGWLDWCTQEQFGDIEHSYHTLLIPKRSARVYTIDTLADFSALIQSFQRIETRFSFLHNVSLDFEKASEEYDAIHLTENGQWETRYSIPGLYGWDCESSIWFRWCFSSTQIIKEPTFVPSQY